LNHPHHELTGCSCSLLPPLLLLFSSSAAALNLRHAISRFPAGLVASSKCLLSTGPVLKPETRNPKPQAPNPQVPNPKSPTPNRKPPAANRQPCSLKPLLSSVRAKTSTKSPYFRQPCSLKPLLSAGGCRGGVFSLSFLLPCPSRHPTSTYTIVSHRYFGRQIGGSDKGGAHAGVLRGEVASGVVWLVAWCG